MFPSTGSTTPISTSKASKVSAIIGDGTFEKAMKERTRTKKEKDEHSIAELKVSMSSLERSLSQEIKRRLFSSRSLETSYSNKILSMEERLNSLIDERYSAVVKRMSLMEKKVEELNLRLEEERFKLPQDIESKAKELEDSLSSFQEMFTVERRDRLNREGRIMEQLSHKAKKLDDRWNEERMMREESVMQLKIQLTEVDHAREKRDVAYESLVKSELKKLKEDMERETNDRKIEDDEIVEALNRYTNNLQSSLSVISSVGN